jgi:hypothetical protein
MTSYSAMAQSDETVAPPATKKIYCDMVGTPVIMSRKVTVTMDFGEKLSGWADNRMKDPETGKTIKFNSMIDAMNFMADDGWELNQAYTVLISNIYNYHWLISKDVPVE